MRPLPLSWSLVTRSRRAGVEFSCGTKMNPRLLVVVVVVVAALGLSVPCAISAPREDAKYPVHANGDGGGAVVGALRLSSWNLEWLADPRELDAAGFWQTCEARNWPNEKPGPGLPMCDVYRRDRIFSAADYEALKLGPLRAALADMAARGLDLLAVQEVRGPAALQAVLPQGFRVACFTTREDAQNIGFAVREAAGLQPRCREIRALSLEDEPRVGHRVRRGLELVLRVNGGNIALLNVHLKSGCPGGRLDNPRNAACPVLQQQASPLEQWIEGQANAGNAFLIVGDWNRDLEQEVRRRFPARSDGSDPAGPIDPATVRNLFPEIDDGKPPASAMVVVAVDRRAAARHGCHATLDQLVVSQSLLGLLDPGSLAGGKPAAVLTRPPGKATDHCSLDTVLPFRAQP